MKSFLPNMFYYGFPIVLLSTIDKEGKANVTPISCSFTIGTNAVIALVKLNKVYHNVMWEKVEAIAPYTAQNPVPDVKKDKYTYTDDKFSIGGFTQLPSEKVRPPRIAECPMQAEAIVKQVNDRDTYAIVELEIVQVHAEDYLVMEGNKINPLEWEPLIYNFKHYYGLGEHKGVNFGIR